MLDTERAARHALTPSAAGSTRIGVPTGLSALITAAVTAMPIGAIAGPVEVIGAPTADREQLVVDGDLDAAVIRTPPTRTDLVAYALPADELLVVGAADHPALSVDPVRLADLRSHPLVFTADAIGNPVCTNTIASCRRAGVEPLLQVLSPGAETLSALTTVTHAWSVFFAAHARQLNTDALGVRFVRCAQPLAVTKCVVVRRDRTDLGARIAAAINDREN